jgi:hypothetical protein
MATLAMMLMLQTGAAVMPPMVQTATALVGKVDAKSGDPDDTIVITAQRPEASAAALAACLARHCSPKEDIAASLTHAEDQFVAGDYKGSRTTLLAARHRNSKYAAELPVEVSDLHRANARLASVSGLIDPARIGSIDAVDALKKGLSGDDVRVFAQRLEVGDAMAKEGRLDGALLHYRWVATKARRAHLPAVEGMALFRSAVLLSAVASVAPRARPDAQRAIERIENNPDPAFAPYRNGVRLMRVRLANAKDKDIALQKAIAQMEPEDSDQPTLAYAPAIDMQDAVYGAAVGDDTPQWADVSFWIAPDGTVKDIDTVRQSDHLNGQWLEVATRALRQRRYLPLKGAADAPGVMRVERYLFVSDKQSPTGSRMTFRANKRRVDIVDLTPVAKVQAKSS